MENWIYCAGVAIIISLYFVFLYKITGKDRNNSKLPWAFVCVVFAGVIVHMLLFISIIRENDLLTEPLTMIVSSVLYSLEMFIGNTLIFKNEVMNVLKSQSHPWLFYSITLIYSMALLTGGFTIFHFISRAIYSRRWLNKNKLSAAEQTSHIFLGVNNASLYLAIDIALKKNQDQIIFIDLPDHEERPHGFSIWELISDAFTENKDFEEIRKKLQHKRPEEEVERIFNNFIILRAGKSIKEGIIHWLANPKHQLYILSDNQSENLNQVEKLLESDKVRCTIYCHAKKEKLINRYDSITDKKDQIKFVDSSFLAVESLKKHETGITLPVKYAEIAKNEDGKTLGYVTKPFNCAIIGFGETGLEALRFIYEFGAFPDKNNKKSPFRCHIFESDGNKLEGELGEDITKMRDPDADEQEFYGHICNVGTKHFWEEMGKLIHSLNYVVISLGDDDLNMKIAVDLAEFAVTKGKSDRETRFMIAIRMQEVSNLNSKTITEVNKAFKVNMVPFGMEEDIWKEKIVNNDEFSSAAKIFHERYSTFAEEHNKGIAKKCKYEYEKETWDSLVNKTQQDNDYGKRCGAKRKIAQNFSNCLHRNTKIDLGSYAQFWTSAILESNTGEKHCRENTSKELQNVLEHLAVCEHLRWNASHIAMGYGYAVRTNDALKQHSCIVPYFKLDEDTKHYDWLVVKSSL